MKTINVTELKTHLSRYLRLASRGRRIVVRDRDEPIAEIGPPRADAAAWHDRLATSWTPRPPCAQSARIRDEVRRR
jgi:antitoxin (DNA-binding transcriptional repressor) of toxin-antitoxin stability system